MAFSKSSAEMGRTSPARTLLMSSRVPTDRSGPKAASEAMFTISDPEKFFSLFTISDISALERECFPAFFSSALNKAFRASLSGSGTKIRLENRRRIAESTSHGQSTRQAVSAFAVKTMRQQL
jgi:hypothetical protein